MLLPNIIVHTCATKSRIIKLDVWGCGIIDCNNDFDNGSHIASTNFYTKKTNKNINHTTNEMVKCTRVENRKKKKKMTPCA